MARARADIETLRALKREARDNPQVFVEGLEDKVVSTCSSLCYLAYAYKGSLRMPV